MRWFHGLSALVLTVSACDVSSGGTQLAAVHFDACGARHATVTIANHGGSAHFKARIEPDGFGLVSPSEGELEEGKDSTFDVTIAGTVAPPAVGAMVLSVGDTDTRVPLEMGPTATSLSFATTNLDFGDQDLGLTTSAVAVDVVNDGATEASVRFAGSGDFSAAWAGGADEARIGPGERRTMSVRFTPSELGPRASTLRLVADGVLCGGGGIALTGRGVDSVIQVTPSSFDWGVVKCSGGPPAKTLTVQNTSTRPVDVRFDRESSSRFWIAPTLATIPAGGKLDFTVSFFGFPNDANMTFDAYATDLLLSTSASKEVRRIRNHISAKGVKLSLLSNPTSSLDYGDVRAGSTTSLPLAFKNDGNIDAQLNFPPNTGAFSVAPSPALVPAGGTAFVQLALTGTYDLIGGQRIGYLSSSAFEPSCGGTSNYTITVRYRITDRVNSIATSSDGTHVTLVSETGRAYQILPTFALHPQTSVSSIVQTDSGGTCAYAGGMIWCDGNIGGGVSFSNQQILGWQSNNALVAGAHHVCSWGYHGGCLGANDEGQLGDGTATSSASPVIQPNSWGPFAAHDDMSCATDYFGTLRCWGNDHGTQRFGAAGVSQTNTPVVVPTSAPVWRTALGPTWVLAQRSGGVLVWWGSGGTLSSSEQVLGAQFAEFDAGCGVSNGNLACFGDGTNARLGDGIFAPHFAMAPVTVNVPQANGSFWRVSSGPTVSYANTQDRRLVTWGANSIPKLVEGYY